MEALVRLKRNMLTNNVMSLYTALRKYVDIFECTSNHPIIGMTPHPYIVLSCANTTSTLVNGTRVIYISVIESIGNDKYYMLNACPRIGPRIGPRPPNHIVAGTAIANRYSSTPPFIASSFAGVYRKAHNYTQHKLKHD